MLPDSLPTAPIVHPVPSSVHPALSDFRSTAAVSGQEPPCSVLRWFSAHPVHFGFPLVPPAFRPALVAFRSASPAVFPAPPFFPTTVFHFLRFPLPLLPMSLWNFPVPHTKKQAGLFRHLTASIRHRSVVSHRQVLSVPPLLHQRVPAFRLQVPSPLPRGSLSFGNPAVLPFFLPVHRAPVPHDRYIRL